MKTSTVKYQLATYEGTIDVTHDEDDEPEYIIAQAKKILRRQVGFFPLGYQSWRII